MCVRMCACFAPREDHQLAQATAARTPPVAVLAEAVGAGFYTLLLCLLFRSGSPLVCPGEMLTFLCARLHLASVRVKQPVVVRSFVFLEHFRSCDDTLLCPRFLTSSSMLPRLMFRLSPVRCFVGRPVCLLLRRLQSAVARFVSLLVRTVMATLAQLCCACMSPQIVLPAPPKADALNEMGLVRQRLPRSKANTIVEACQIQREPY